MYRRALGPTHPPIQWVLGALSLGQKLRGAILPLPQYAFTVWYSFKAREQLYFYLIEYNM
jgi:hypothetical protein